MRLSKAEDTSLCLGSSRAVTQLVKMHGWLKPAYHAYGRTKLKTDESLAYYRKTWRNLRFSFHSLTFMKLKRKFSV
jgi:hypothetical protein